MAGLGSSLAGTWAALILSAMSYADGWRVWFAEVRVGVVVGPDKKAYSKRFSPCFIESFGAAEAAPFKTGLLQTRNF